MAIEAEIQPHPRSEAIQDGWYADNYRIMPANSAGPLTLLQGEDARGPNRSFEGSLRLTAGFELPDEEPCGAAGRTIRAFHAVRMAVERARS